MKSTGETEKRIDQLVHAAIRQGLIEAEDRIYAINRLCDRLQIEGFESESTGLDEDDSQTESIPVLLNLLTDAAVARGLLEDLTDLREILAADLMNVFVDRPSVIQTRFDCLNASDPASATDWFYRMSQASNYIQTRQIARNVVYQAESPYGTLDITINLSKPEKNPRDIAAARLHRSSGYPRCLLCIENEGYAGRIGHPARANHRMIRMRLGGESWYLQYSPYAYYPEHCIVLSQEHRDMHIDRSTLDKLLEFVTMFPHYFIGSNADLPVVGGSILSHDHYQGGRYELPMARAGEAFTFHLPAYPGLQAAVLNWPMATIRLGGSDACKLADAAESILAVWRQYSDPAAGIIARDDQGPHNTITPIARRRGSDYEMDLVLRNNRHDDSHPLGIFHPHADVHHIKKENIGLIEVMGLAVLPGRLLSELEAVEHYLQNQPATVAPAHLSWAEQLRQQFHGPLTGPQARSAVRVGVACIFERVLADAGVYKTDAAGQTAFRRFLAATGAVDKQLAL